MHCSCLHLSFKKLVLGRVRLRLIFMSETMNRGQLKLPFLVCWINTKKKQTKKKKLNADLLTVTIYTTLFWIRKLNYKDYANVLDLIFYFFFFGQVKQNCSQFERESLDWPQQLLFWYLLGCFRSSILKCKCWKRHNFFSNTDLTCSLRGCFNNRDCFPL